jgi:hypothetical protein
MASKGISLRLEEELLAWVDEYARARGVSRSAVIAMALEGLRDLPSRPAGRPAAVSSTVPRAKSVVARDAGSAYARMMRERQERLNRRSG